MGTAIGCQAQTTPAPRLAEKVRCDPAGAPRQTPPQRPCPLGQLQELTASGSFAGRCVAVEDCLPITCDPAFTDGCPTGWGCGAAGVCSAE